VPLLLALLITACNTDPEPVTCAEGELLDGDTCVPEACGTGTWGGTGRPTPRGEVNGLHTTRPPGAHCLGGMST
jgi:hypothetical protein